MILLSSMASSQYFLPLPPSAQIDFVHLLSLVHDLDQRYALPEDINKWLLQLNASSFSIEQLLFMLPLFDRLLHWNNKLWTKYAIFYHFLTNCRVIKECKPIILLSILEKDVCSTISKELWKIIEQERKCTEKEL